MFALATIVSVNGQTEDEAQLPGDLTVLTFEYLAHQPPCSTDCSARYFECYDSEKVAFSDELSRTKACRFVVPETQSCVPQRMVAWYCPSYRDCSDPLDALGYGAAPSASYAQCFGTTKMTQGDKWYCIDCDCTVNAYAALEGTGNTPAGYKECTFKNDDQCSHTLYAPFQETETPQALHDSEPVFIRADGGNGETLAVNGVAGVSAGGVGGIVVAFILFMLL